MTQTETTTRAEASFAMLRDLIELKNKIAVEMKTLDQLIAEPKAALMGRMQTVEAEIDEVRSGIERYLGESGEQSYTDPATGINAHFKNTTSWRVTDREELTAAARERPDLGLMVVDEKAAIALSKKSSEALPGIEQVTTPVFTILPPKAKK